MNTDSLTALQSLLLSSAGSYWSQLKGSSLQLSRALAGMSESVDPPFSVSNIENRLGRRRLAFNRTIDIGEVKVVEYDWNSRLVLPGGNIVEGDQENYDSISNHIRADTDFLLGSPYATSTAVPEGFSTREAMYLVECNDIVPIVLVTSDHRLLTLGTGFTYIKPYLVFREDPNVVFREERIAARVVYEEGDSLFSYLHGLSASSSDKAVSDFYRESQSLKFYERALNAAAGSFVPEKDEVALAVHKIPSYACYVKTESGFLPAHPETNLTRYSIVSSHESYPELVKVYNYGKTAEIEDLLTKQGNILNFFGEGYHLPFGTIGLEKSESVVYVGPSGSTVEEWFVVGSNNKALLGSDGNPTFSSVEAQPQEIQTITIGDIPGVTLEGVNVEVDLAYHLVTQVYRNQISLVEVDSQNIAEDNLRDVMWFLDAHKPTGSLQYIVRLDP